MLNTELHSEQPCVYQLDSAVNIVAVFTLALCVCMCFRVLFNHLKQVINYHFTPKYLGTHVLRKVTFFHIIVPLTCRKTKSNSVVSHIPFKLKLTQFFPNCDSYFSLQPGYMQFYVSRLSFNENGPSAALSRV